MPAAKIKPSSSKRQDAYERVLNAIIFGEIMPDVAIDEKNLAIQLGIGLAGMRDALNRLSLEGLVQRHARIGTRVAGLSINDLQEVFEVRLLIESRCAALAAERATAADIEALKTAFNGFEKVIQLRKFRELVAMDQKFHRRLAASTYNTQLQNIVVVMHNSASRFWYFGLSKLPPDSIIDDIHGHFKVVSAIERRDPEAAAEAIRLVLGHFPESVSTFFGQPQLQRHRGSSQ